MKINQPWEAVSRNGRFATTLDGVLDEVRAIPEVRSTVVTKYQRLAMCSGNFAVRCGVQLNEELLVSLSVKSAMCWGGVADVQFVGDQRISERVDLNIQLLSRRVSAQLGCSVWMKSSVNYTRRLSPIRQVLPSQTKRLVFCATSVSTFVPLHALYRMRTGQRIYVLEEYEEVSYTPSAAILIRCRQREEPRPTKTLGPGENPNEDLGYSEWEIRKVELLLSIA